MLSISHGVTGAFVATLFPHPLLYVPLAVCLHYLEDWTLHWDVGTGLSSGKRKRSTAILLEFVDLALMVAAIYYIWNFTGTPITPNTWAGAFAALIPDFLEAPRNFLKWEPEWLKPFSRFHSSLHHSTPKMLLGLTPQVVVLATVAFLLWRLQTA